MEETNTAPEMKSIATTKKTEQPLAHGILLWTFPIWWPLLYGFILGAANSVLHTMGIALYVLIPPFIFTVLFLSGFFIAYLISLFIIKVSLRTHVYTLIIWFMLSISLLAITGVSETTMEMNWMIAAGCPREQVLRLRR